MVEEFKQYAIDFFGKECVETCLNDEIVKEAMDYAEANTDDAKKEVFLNYLFANYI